MGCVAFLIHLCQELPNSTYNNFFKTGVLIKVKLMHLLCLIISSIHFKILNLDPKMMCKKLITV